VARSADGDDVLRALVRDFDLGSSELQQHRTVKNLLQYLFRLPQNKFRELGLNLAAVSGLSGDWSFSLEVVQRLLDAGDDSAATKLWHLRSLIELERFAEALAVSQSTRWGAKEWIHVNYLSGIAFEALGLFDEAKNRWESVQRADPQYRDIALRLSRY
jgi:hypothetical protein